MSEGDHSRPLASVVVRNRNQRGHLEKLFRALALQTIRPEIVFVDNESTDGSVALATANGAKLVPITTADFTYGRAINLGVRNAEADIVILLSSHSLPIGDNFIESCLKPFADTRVAAARCLRLENAREWLNPPMLEGQIKWDVPLPLLPENNGCVFRKSVWLQIPFDEQLEAAEDKLWAYQVLNAGYRIATAPALYEYCGVDAFWASLRRYKRVQTALYRMRGVQPKAAPLGTFMRDVFVGVPRAAVSGAMRLLLTRAISATVPWQARRPPRAGSVR